ncbi:hypothetical protein CapIbe_016266 [Capra ibex]
MADRHFLFFLNYANNIQKQQANSDLLGRLSRNIDHENFSFFSTRHGQRVLCCYGLICSVLPPEDNAGIVNVRNTSARRGLWDLGSPTRYRTWVPCSESPESRSLAWQRMPGKGLSSETVSPV